MTVGGGRWPDYLCRNLNSTHCGVKVAPPHRTVPRHLRPFFAQLEVQEEVCRRPQRGWSGGSCGGATGARQVRKRNHWRRSGSCCRARPTAKPRRRSQKRWVCPRFRFVIGRDSWSTKAFTKLRIHGRRWTDPLAFFSQTEKRPRGNENKARVDRIHRQTEESTEGPPIALNLGPVVVIGCWAGSVRLVVHEKGSARGYPEGSLAARPSGCAYRSPAHSELPGSHLHGR